MEEMKAFFERLQEIPEDVNVDAVFGKSQTIEGRTLIPVAELSYGFGIGMGTPPCCTEEGEAEEEAEKALEPSAGGGGGAGVRARPIAYIEVGPEGTHIEPVMDEQKVALAGILLAMWAVGWIGLVLKTLFSPRS